MPVQLFVSQRSGENHIKQKRPQKKLGHVGEYSFSCTRGAISCLPAVVAVDGRLSDYVRWEFKQCVR